MKSKTTLSVFSKKDFGIRLVSIVVSRNFLLAIALFMFSWNGMAQYDNSNNGRTFVTESNPPANYVNVESDVAGFSAFNKKAVHAKSQYLYTYNEVKGYGSDSDSITKISLHIISSGTAAVVYSNVTIRLGYTTDVAWPNGSHLIEPNNPLQLIEVFSGPLTITKNSHLSDDQKWIDFPFHSPFPLNVGLDNRNIIVEVSYDYAGGAAGGPVTMSCSQIKYANAAQARGCIGATVLGKDLYTTGSKSSSDTFPMKISTSQTGAFSRTQRPYMKFTFKATQLNTEGITYSSTSSRVLGDPITITPVIYGTGLSEFRWLKSNAPNSGFVAVGDLGYSSTPELITPQPAEPTYYQMEARIGTTTFLTSFNSSAAVVEGVKRYTSTGWVDSNWGNGNEPVSGESAYFTVTPVSWPFSSGDVVALSSIGVKDGETFTVPSGKTLKLDRVLKDEDIQGDLIFENSASLIQTTTAQNNAARVIYKRDSQPLLRFDYTYYSSPVKGKNLFSVSPQTLADKFWSYANNGWVMETDTTTMTPGKGYIIRGSQEIPISGVRQVHPATFDGIPNNGNISIAVDPIAGHYNLIGNPYPSAIDPRKFILNNNFLEGSIYLWSHASQPSIYYPGTGTYNYNNADYVGVTGLGATDGSSTNFVGAGQSFMVKTETAGTNFVQWTNDMRLAGQNSVFYKMQNPNLFPERATVSQNSPNSENAEPAGRFWLKLEANNGAVQRMLIGYVEGATEDYDRMYDAEPMEIGATALYAIASNQQRLAIMAKGLPFNNEQIIPLGFVTAVPGNHTISKFQEDGFMENYAVYINDRLTNTTHNLSESAYEFTTIAGTFNNRFIIAYKLKASAIVDNSVRPNKVVVFDKFETVQLHSGKDLISSIVVYDLSGKVLANVQNCNSTEITLSKLPRKNQLIVVEIYLANGDKEVQKFKF